MTLPERSDSADITGGIPAIEGRVIAAELELRSIRAALAVVSRCTCPVGFGSEPDHRCPKHGNRL